MITVSQKAHSHVWDFHNLLEGLHMSARELALLDSFSQYREIMLYRNKQRQEERILEVKHDILNTLEKLV